MRSFTLECRFFNLIKPLKALQDYESSTHKSSDQHHDHQFTQLQTLSEVAESPSSPAIVPDAILKKRSSHRDVIKISSRSHTPSRSHRRNKKIPDDVSSAVKRCDLCGTTETPRWRGNSVGSGLLCNVCGLIQTKRIARKNLTVSRDSTSTMSSSQR
jgi:hypothetical protein